MQWTTNAATLLYTPFICALARGMYTLSAKAVLIEAPVPSVPGICALLVREDIANAEAGMGITLRGRSNGMVGREGDLLGMWCEHPPGFKPSWRPRGGFVVRFRSNGCFQLTDTSRWLASGRRGSCLSRVREFKSFFPRQKAEATRLVLYPMTQFVGVTDMNCG